jgi:hypothetical protein
MKEHQNKKHRMVEFAVCDWVLLHLHHRTAIGITTASSSKLRPNFFGPYQVTECIGEVAYRLHLPPMARIHDVLHVTLLKKFVGGAAICIGSATFGSPWLGGSHFGCCGPCSPQPWPLAYSCSLGRLHTY